MNCNAVCWAVIAAVVLNSVGLCAAEPTAVFVMNPAGSGVRRLAQVDGFRQHGSPRWSHDGAQLAFDASEGPNDARKFFAIGADGTGLREMGEHGSPDWSPDDKQLAFHFAGPQAKQGTWVQNVDGKGREWLALGTSPRWSRDGGLLATIHERAMLVFDLVEGGQRRFLDASFGDIAPGFDWSPDGAKLAFVATRDGKQELWIASAADPNQKTAPRLAGDLDGYLAWSPDGKQLIITLDNRLQLLAVEGADSPRLIPGQQGHSRMPAWSPDGELVAFVSDRKTPVLAQVARTKRAIRLDEIARNARGCIVYSLAWSPDGRRAVFGGTERSKNLHVWEIADDRAKSLDYYGAAVAFSTDGHTVAYSGRTTKIQLINVDTGDLIRDLHAESVCASIDFSADGALLASGSNNGAAAVWDVASGKRLGNFKQHTKPVTRVVFLPSGKEVATACQDKTVRIWDAQTAEQRLALEHPEAVWGLAVSPNGRLIATGTGGASLDNPVLQRIEQGEENVVRLWDTTSGNLVREMKGHNNVVYALDFSPDGRTLASGGMDGVVRLWDVDSGEELANVLGRGPALAVAFSPDGSQLLVGGGGNRVGNIQIQTFPEEEIRLYRVVETGAAKP